MTKSNRLLQFLVLSVGALIVVTALNIFIDAGAVLHDVVCPQHGWLA